jgi:hypothetical protein
MGSVAEQTAVRGAARFGYLSKAAVFVTVGLLALDGALRGKPNEPQGPPGALAELVRQPFGRTLLAILTIGLASYAVWRQIQAIANTERRQGWKGALARVGYAFSGLFYGALAVECGWLSLANARRSPVGRRAHLGPLLATDAGKIIFAVVGLSLVGGGIALLVKAWRGRFRDDDKGLPRGRLRHATLALGRIGYGTRGILWLLTGSFLVIAAWRANPHEPLGTSGVFRWVLHSAYGSLLLACLAAGLIAYSLHLLALARWRRIDLG